MEVRGEMGVVDVIDRGREGDILVVLLLLLLDVVPVVLVSRTARAVESTHPSYTNTCRSQGKIFCKCGNSGAVEDCPGNVKTTVRLVPICVRTLQASRRQSANSMRSIFGLEIRFSSVRVARLVIHDGSLIRT